MADNVRTEKITPEKAESWLNSCNNTNRKLRDGIAESYSADMKAGKWTTCIDPIAFYEDGQLANGQHRLWAILDSGTTQEFLVARGLERKDGLNIDTGFSRTIVDNGRISGLDVNLSNTLVSTARAVHYGRDNGSFKLSNSARLELVGKYREACEWAIANGPKTKFLCNTVVLSAIARAWYYEDDKNKLKRFCDVLRTGFSQGDSESAAVAIRNYMLEKSSVASTYGLWGDTFLKIQNAIKYFMQDKKLTVIKAIKDEAYPLDGRRVRKKA